MINNKNGQRGGRSAGVEHCASLAFYILVVIVVAAAVAVVVVVVVVVLFFFYPFKLSSSQPMSFHFIN